ncbi:hypothetical protein FPSE_02560 [Fusarium pseudograminearum CS3096]|uniref:Uncharacterized protein n=1 Tax=Fusarium pseudograminearum (strain CS3096) TaxID=1028729 RepID=K3W2A0_FUSPC|nr:hypothetical protein FPSE_02560 [Fusarium pseudograminearum CS3096]EKJ77285.1 hypothetical protein FPSE_02560 [Fusarium pseudograminearum CS3096]
MALINNRQSLLIIDKQLTLYETTEPIN